MTTILDGKSLSASIGKELKVQIKQFESVPHLAIIQVGDNSESNTYIKYKKSFGEKIGAKVTHLKFKEDITTEKLIKEIEDINTNKTIHGIIIQLPLPTHLDRNKIIDTINHNKDVDGLTSQNMTSLLRGEAQITPATTRGIMTLLKHYKININGKRVVVVGRSNLVGKPTALTMLNAGATVTVCHRETLDLKQETTKADILIVAVGKPKLITRNYVSPNQIIIDVGVSTIDTREKGISGDVDFDTVKDLVGAITPVPGGVGPMTVASLFQNLLDTYKNQI